MLFGSGCCALNDTSQCRFIELSWVSGVVTQPLSLQVMPLSHVLSLCFLYLGWCGLAYFISSNLQESPSFSCISLSPLSLCYNLGTLDLINFFLLCILGFKPIYWILNLNHSVFHFQTFYLVLFKSSMLFSWVSLSCMYFQACLLLKYCLSVVCACNPSIGNSSLFSLISPGFLSWSFLSLLVYLFFWLQMTPFLWGFFFFLRKFFKGWDKGEILQRGFLFSSPKCQECFLSRYSKLNQ